MTTPAMIPPMAPPLMPPLLLGVGLGTTAAGAGAGATGGGGLEGLCCGLGGSPGCDITVPSELDGFTPCSVLVAPDNPAPTTDSNVVLWLMVEQF